MGKRGPAPKPTSLRLLHGEQKKNPQRINRNEPKPGELEINATVELSEHAAEVWDRLADDLERVGVLTAWDCDAFASYCEAVAAWREAMVDVKANGPVIEETKASKTGELYQVKAINPAWRAAKEAADLQLKFGARFGLTPSDRSQISIPGAGNDGDDKKDPARLLS